MKPLRKSFVCLTCILKLKFLKFLKASGVQFNEIARTIVFPLRSIYFNGKNCRYWWVQLKGPMNNKNASKFSIFFEIFSFYTQIDVFFVHIYIRKRIKKKSIDFGSHYFTWNVSSFIFLCFLMGFKIDPLLNPFIYFYFILGSLLSTNLI